jgi:hypothetical protein
MTGDKWGRKWLDLRGCLIHGMKRRGGEMAGGCCAELGAVAPWRRGRRDAGRRHKASVGGAPLLQCRRRKKRLGGSSGPELKRNSFQNKNWIFEFTKALEICTRRFRMNFDTRILNSSTLLKNFWKIWFKYFK